MFISVLRRILCHFTRDKTDVTDTLSRACYQWAETLAGGVLGAERDCVWCGGEEGRGAVADLRVGDEGRL